MKQKDYKEYIQILNSTIIPESAPLETKRTLFEPLHTWITNHIPEKLYKFRTCNEQNISAFRNQQIWFSVASKMNDDYDSFIWFDKEKIRDSIFCLFDDAGILKHDKLFGFMSNNITAKEKENLKCIETAINILKNMNIQDYNQFSIGVKSYLLNQCNLQLPIISQSLQKGIKLSSFSEVISSPAMWGHYADNSTGYALAYDFRNNYFNECPYCDSLKACQTPKYNSLMPIVYGNKPLDATEHAIHILQKVMATQLISNSNLSDEEKTNILFKFSNPDIYMQQRILTRKSSEWKYEKEWRMTLSYDGPQYLTDQVAYIKKKPSALYLGRKIKETDELILRHIAFKQNIPVYKMTLSTSDKGYRLSPESVKNTPEELFLK